MSGGKEWGRGVGWQLVESIHLHAYNILVEKIFKHCIFYSLLTAVVVAVVFVSLSTGRKFVFPPPIPARPLALSPCLPLLLLLLLAALLAIYVAQLTQNERQACYVAAPSCIHPACLGAPLPTPHSAFTPTYYLPP